VEKGPASERVADNVKELRTERRLKLDDLADRLAELGRPILKTGLSKLETGARRVDVDDLLALALVLDVTPNRLLLTADAGDETVELVPDMQVPAASAWAWACGDELIVHGYAGDDPKDARWSSIRPRYEEFTRVNRPHDPKDLTPLEDLLPHRAVLDRLVEAVRDVEATGVSRKAAYAYVELQLRTPNAHLVIKGSS
jgi:transcriptional regulator with XRE-family HTH domain